MSRTMLRISFLISIALCTVPSQAQVLHVDDSAPAGGDGSSWALALQDLAEALTIASSTGVSQVWVAQGRYLPSASDPSVSFVLPDGVLVYGGFEGTETGLEQRDPAAHPTLLDGDLNGDDQPNCIGRADNSLHVVQDRGGASSHLDGFTVRGGLAGPGAGLFLTADEVTLARLIVAENCALMGTKTGGGVEILGGRVEVKDCVFRDNRAIGGAGLLLREPRSALVSSSRFERHAATGGGGLSIQGARTGSIVARACSFLDSSVNTGGGIQVSVEELGSLLVDGCTFERNLATSGGGISVITENRQAPARVDLLDSVFRANEATAGGGIYLHEAGGILPTQSSVSGCTFEDNRGCAGGGIYTNTGPVVVERCAFRNNDLLIPDPFPCGLGTGGGAIRADLENAAVAITSSSFSRSESSLLWAQNGAELRAKLVTLSNSGRSAPSIRLTGASRALLDGCIVWGDAAGQIQADAAASFSATYSDVRMGGAVVPGTGNLEAEPLFVDAAGHDLRLLPGSPCVDAGDPAVLLSGRDVGRYSRMTDGNLDHVLRVDMGAHEASPIELAITGTPAPGSTLTIETSGQPGLSAFLALDPPGLHFFPRAGSLFLTLTGGLLSHWPSAPSTTPVSVPAGLNGLFHAQAIVLDRGAIAFSNFVPLSF